MTQEDRELLLKDLSGRLLHGVKVTTANPAVEIGVISGISIKGNISVSTKDADIVFGCTEVKPYLRPMSSMTGEEKEEFGRLVSLFAFTEVNDWLNRNHLDYRGLIQKGLALEVTPKNNPYKL